MGTAIKKKKTLAAEAAEVSREHDALVFPTGANKRPCLPVADGWHNEDGKGGFHIASDDPAEIEKMFSQTQAHHIAVAMGRSELFCFDIDFRSVPEGATPEQAAAITDRNTRLQRAYDKRLKPVVDRGGARVHKSKNGGLHVIMQMGDMEKHPAAIMPKLELKGHGGYINWPSEGSGYEVVVDTPLIDCEEVTPELVEVIEGRIGQSTGGGVMSYGECIEILEDETKGERHEALNSVALHRMRHDPNQPLEAAAEAVQEVMVTYIPKGASRYDDLTELSYDGTGSEIVRSLKPLMAGGNKRYMVSTEGTASARLAAAAQGLVDKDLTNVVLGPFKNHVQPILSEETKAAAKEFIEEQRQQAVTGFAVAMTVEQIESDIQPEIDWVLQDLIATQNLIGIAGPSGAGKTRFMSALLAGLSGGCTDIIGLPPSEPTAALYIANEERTVDVHRRVKAAARLNGLRSDLALHVHGKDQGRVKLVDAEGKPTETVDTIIDYANLHKIKVIFLDPFNTLGTEDENAAGSTGGTIDQLQRMTTETDAAVFFVHHTPKGNDAADMRGDASAFRGSGAIYSALDLGVTLFPYLPAECFEKQNGRANRHRLAELQRERKVPKFIVLDPAKERENEPLVPVYYRLSSHEVNEGGQPIGAIKQVTKREADNVLTAALSGGAKREEVAKRNANGVKLIRFHEKHLKKAKDGGVEIKPGDMAKLLGSKDGTPSYSRPQLKQLISEFAKSVAVLDGDDTKKVVLTKKPTARYYRVEVSEEASSGA